MPGIVGWLAQLLKREEELSHNARLGRAGERVAANYLKARGYSILKRNYRSARGEIDIVAFRDGVLAFVEVRAQTLPALVDPLRTVTRRKQRRIIAAAHAYLASGARGDAHVAPRFDVVSVLFDGKGRAVKVEQIEGAFQETPKGFA